MIGTVFVLTWAMGADPLMQIFSGGLFLGAFFMATDMVTSPTTSKGRVVFALGLGILISLIRMKGGYPEGTAYAILIMNGVVPLIDRYIRPKKVWRGEQKMENRYIHFGIVLGLIAAISAGLLGGVNDFTSKVIAENTKKIVNAARIEVLPEATSFKEDEAKEADGMQYIPGFNAAGEVVGYVASVTEPGYGGDINFVVGINNDAKITGLNVVTSLNILELGAKN